MLPLRRVKCDEFMKDDKQNAYHHVVPNLIDDMKPNELSALAGARVGWRQGEDGPARAGPDRDKVASIKAAMREHFDSQPFFPSRSTLEKWMVDPSDEQAKVRSGGRL